MPQAIPLTTNLRVERPDIVVYDPRRFMYDFLMEECSVKEGFLGRCLCRDGPVERNPGWY
jgi:hypothetical protein